LPCPEFAGERLGPNRQRPLALLLVVLFNAAALLRVLPALAGPQWSLDAFIRMLQGFMGLGLVTGVAALGVIAFRSVTERRQQIGMLRAIGYQTGSIALTFVLESGFIALMGILSGVVGGMIIARNLFTSGQFSGEGGIQFTIPWAELLVIVGVAFVVSLFMTWWPSRQAARVPVAEALRYE
jgi:putative ABC transport system permease protein